jgi:hypothetical protein
MMKSKPSAVIEGAFTLDDVDEVIDDTPLATHDEVEVAQPDVEVDYGNFLAAACEPAGKAGGGGRFAHASLT